MKFQRLEARSPTGGVPRGPWREGGAGRDPAARPHWPSKREVSRRDSPSGVRILVGCARARALGHSSLCAATLGLRTAFEQAAPRVLPTNDRSHSTALPAATSRNHAARHSTKSGNFAAAGGDEQRLFPWSKPPADSTIDCSYANYADYDAATQCNSNVLIPGSFPKGDGRWSHADLLGNVVEWTLDSYLDYVNPCVNGVNLLPATYTSLRGGCFYGIPGSPYVSGRILDMPQRVSRGFGVRCARSP